MEQMELLRAENESLVQQIAKLTSHLGVAKQTILDLSMEFDQGILANDGSEIQHATRIEMLYAELQEQNDAESNVAVSHQTEVSLLQQKLATLGQDLESAQGKISELNKQLVEMRQLHNATQKEFSIQLKRRLDIAAKEKAQLLLQSEALRQSHETTIKQLKAEICEMELRQLQNSELLSNLHSHDRPTTRQANMVDRELLVSVMMHNNALAGELARIRSDPTDGTRIEDSSLESIATHRRQLMSIVAETQKRYDVLCSIIRLHDYCSAKIAELQKVQQESEYLTMSVDPPDNCDQARGCDTSSNARMPKRAYENMELPGDPPLFSAEESSATRAKNAKMENEAGTSSMFHKRP